MSSSLMSDLLQTKPQCFDADFEYFGCGKVELEDRNKKLLKVPILLIFQGHVKLNVYNMPRDILNIRENERKDMQTC